MIEVTPTREQVLEARREAGNLGPIAGSILGGQGNTIGFLGEIIVRDLTGYKQVNTSDYDLLVEQSGRRVDVKSKQCKSTPHPSYDCSVAAHGTQQDCDDYVFVRIHNNLSRAWILGTIPKVEYFNKATRYQKGDLDESNGYVVKADCYNLKISELWTLPTS